MGFINNRQIGEKYFKLIKYNISNIEIDYYLKQFNINDYYIFKASNKYKQIEINDLLNGKYSTYIFFRKDKYNLGDILKWIDYIYVKLNFKSVPLYWIKPFPPIEVMNKIKIIDKI